MRCKFLICGRETHPHFRFLACLGSIGQSGRIAMIRDVERAAGFEPVQAFVNRSAPIWDHREAVGQNDVVEAGPVTRRV